MMKLLSLTIEKSSQGNFSTVPDTEKFRTHTRLTQISRSILSFSCIFASGSPSPYLEESVTVLMTEESSNKSSVSPALHVVVSWESFPLLGFGDSHFCR